ncbi:MAG: hypothetical protein ACYTF3_06405 [Planctomycetota bacterium]|jgi:hypothetical protein
MVDFGEPGSFTFPGGAAACQMAGIHTGTWTAEDNTDLMFAGSSTTPINPTAPGTVIDGMLTWNRTATGPGERADRFTGPAKATPVEGGPFNAGNAFDPVKLCVYDMMELNNINTGEVAAAPSPFIVTCNGVE